MRRGERLGRRAAVSSLEVDGAPVTLAVYDRDDERLAPRAARRRPNAPQRARLAEVEALLGPLAAACEAPRRLRARSR